MRVACLLMAAGEASRFGGIKQLAKIDGRPMLLERIDQLKPIFKDDLYTVIGANAEEIRPLIESESHVIENAHWRRGLGASISNGVREVMGCSNCDGIMVALADQVALQYNDYKNMMYQYDGEQIVAARYQDHLGVPVIFPSWMYQQLIDLEGDEGARRVLQQNPNRVKAVSLPHAAIDIDTPYEYEKFMEAHDVPSKAAF